MDKEDRMDGYRRQNADRELDVRRNRIIVVAESGRRKRGPESAPPLNVRFLRRLPSSMYSLPAVTDCQQLEQDK